MWPSVAGGLFVAAVVFGLAGWSAWSSSFSENIAMSDEIMPARILVAIVAIWAFVGFVIHFLSPWLEARIGL
ncbi:hypothetical protein [Xanthomonas arboricola]|uniref:hypothetical protein n=1 Tax=Xanthomonas arboricola TaxID=56448 RepID=UPI00063E6DFC|nr:hypothetical protein [Xanthomonas arboricola]MBB3849760.1 hypothetical protein [Xanthomonas arboricola]